MRTVTLTDEQWQRLLPLLRSCPNIYVGQEAECRRFLEAVAWVARSGAQWRLLPAEYGAWNTIYKRFARWSRQGVFERLHELCAGDRDLEHLLLDSTTVRAHACAAGAHKKRARKLSAEAAAGTRLSSTSRRTLSATLCGSGSRAASATTTRKPQPCSTASRPRR